VNLRAKKKRLQRKVGREEEGSSSNCVELAAFVLALRCTPLTTPMLYLHNSAAEGCERKGRRRREIHVCENSQVVRLSPVRQVGSVRTGNYLAR